MDHSSKRLYIRYLSNVVRKWAASSSVNNMTENPVFPVDGTSRAVIVTICRIRQRILSQAWAILVKHTGVKHDYEADARLILYRHIPDTELRTELEIEVLYKWVLQVKDLDPTGIANTIFMCKKKAVVYAALQQIRLEFYEKGETVLFEGDIPRPEDGHFTVFKGECEVLQFPDESVPLMKLIYFAKKKRWDDAKVLLNSAPIVARIPKLSGFGELSTLTGVKRAASIRISPKLQEPAEILILPKDALLDCLKSRTTEDVEGAATNEAIDFLRQSGLANRISPKDLVSAASSMIRKTLVQGEILYYKGEKAKSIYLVVSGEFLLDTGDFMVNGQPGPFVRATDDRCYHLTSGSILGEESVVGESNVYLSTAAVVSSAAVVFEAVNFGMNFLAEKVGGLRYSALYYRDKLCWDFAQPIAEQNNPYTFFNSLRKSISHMKPYRALESLAAAASSDFRIQEQAKKIHSKKQAESKKQKPLSQLSLFPSPLPAIDSKSEPIEDNPFLSYPRSLSGVGLHRAVEINKHVKKMLQSISRSHAKETILYEQLNRIPDEEKVDDDILHAERLFEQNLKEYYDRCALQSRRLKEEEELRRRVAATRASSAIRFFSADISGLADEDETATQGTANIDEEAKTDLEIAREEAVKAANEAISNNSLRRNRDSIIADINMAKLYNLDTVDRSTLHDNKLELYFQWVDSLTLMAHKNLLQQAEQTAEELHDLLHHDHSTHFLLGMKSIEQAMSHTNGAYEDGRWTELGKIFHQFGLTPLDMTPQWMGRNEEKDFKFVDPRSPVKLDSVMKPSEPPDKSEDPSKSATSATATAPVASENKSEKRGSRDEMKQKFKEKRSGTLKSIKSVKSQVFKAKSSNSKNAPSSSNVQGKEVSFAAKEHEEKLIKAHLDSKYKSYTPASWRDDLIQKKSQEATVAHVFHFLRATTPDNRRTVSLHIVPPHRDASGPLAAHHAHPVTDTVDKTAAVASSGNQEQDIERAVESSNKSLIDYDQFITEPDYFMTALRENPLDHIHRMKRDMDAWDTRFMNVRNPKRNSAGAELSKVDEETEARKILDKVTLPQIVRTHLKENLEQYSRNEILAAAQNQLQHSETHFMRVIFGKELENYTPSASLRNSWSNSFLEHDSPLNGRRRKSSMLKEAMSAAIAAVDGAGDSVSLHTPLSSTSPSLQDALRAQCRLDQAQDSIEGKNSPSVISVATSEKEYEADILRSLPPLGDAQFSTTLRAPNAAAGDVEQSILTMPSVAEGEDETLTHRSAESTGNNLLDPAAEAGSNAGSSAGDDSDRDDNASTHGDEVEAALPRSTPATEAAVQEVDQHGQPQDPSDARTVPAKNSHDLGLTVDVNLVSTPSTVPTATLIPVTAANTTGNQEGGGAGGGFGRRSSPMRMAKGNAAQKVYIRYTDTKPSSNALQEFESFMKLQDPNFTKAKAEGRKRANQKCKYRLAPSLRGDPELLAAAIAQQQRAALLLQQQQQLTELSNLHGSTATSLHGSDTKKHIFKSSNVIDLETTLGKDIHLRPKVSLKRIVMERLKSEVAVFQAMYPKASMLQRRNFIESFQRNFPDSEITVEDFEEAAKGLTLGRQASVGYFPPSPTSNAPMGPELGKRRQVDANDHIPMHMLTLAKKMMNPGSPSGSRAVSPTGGGAPRSPLAGNSRGKLISRGGTSGSPIRPGTSSSPKGAMSPKRGSLLRSSSMFMLDVAESAVNVVHSPAETKEAVTNILTLTDDEQAIETSRTFETFESSATAQTPNPQELVTPVQRRIEAAKSRRRHSILMNATQAMLQMNEDEMLNSYDVELDDDNAHVEDWQRYTIQCIVKEKSGERKILPSIATKKTMDSLALSGKRYRGESGGGYSLITLPSKQSEQPISGPTSYMELYKTSFHIPTSRRMKEKIQKELKEAAKNLNY